MTAAVLYAFSFEVVQYARWLSNPSPALITIILSFWSFWNFIKGKKWGLPLTLFFWGLSVQFEFFMIYQIVVFAIIWFALNGIKLPRVKKREVYQSLLALFLPFLTFLLVEIKFNFNGLKALLSFFKTQSQFGTSFSEVFIRYTDQLASTFFLNIMGLNLPLAATIGIVIVFLSIKFIKKDSNIRKPLIFLLSWVFSSALLQFFRGTDATFTNIGIGLAIILLFSAVIVLIQRESGVPKFIYPIIISLVLVGNLSLIISQNKKSEVLFFVQNEMTLKDEMKVLDWVYQESQGEQFKLNTITNPLFINTTWAYLFDWYGKNEYGYMPIWWGETQVNVHGDHVKFENNQEVLLHFLIIEPGPGIPEKYVYTIQDFEDERSKLIKTKKIGSFTVEKREIIKNKVFTSSDVFERIKQE